VWYEDVDVHDRGVGHSLNLMKVRKRRCRGLATTRSFASQKRELVVNHYYWEV
jgi:hypothetical protein